jgi:hypothetical protein
MTLLRPTFIIALAGLTTMPALTAAPLPQGEVQPATALASPLAAQPIEQLSATRERPLFSPTRRPPTPPPVVQTAAPPRPPPPPPDVALFGVVMDGGEAHAIVRAGPAAKVVRVRIGDDVGGWKVSQIDERQLVLSLNGRSATFTMFTTGGRGAPGADAISQKPPNQVRPNRPTASEAKSPAAGRPPRAWQ